MAEYTSAKFDFPTETRVDKIVVVAASYRCGSTLLSLCLWREGRFGAPMEYFNYEKDMEIMMARLAASDVDDYVEKAMRCRTSANGVFSVKAHFHHFETLLQKSAVWRSYVRRARFVYINRTDKVAQAVSMSKALQDNAWMSFDRPRRAPLLYSAQHIEECLREVMLQTEAWWRWFDEEGIQPFTIVYEELCSNIDAHLGSLARWLGVERDEVDPVGVPLIDRQADRVNREWIDRFVAERRV